MLHGSAENGLSNGTYRGRMVLSRDGGAVLVVNHVSLEHYLYGVVPAEMPASWPAEALKAQAVVARSYALTSRSSGLPWDVFADVRSQVYRGVLAEVPASTAAVRATRGRVVTVGGAVAQTFFFSTSGGRTAANEEGFGGTPLSYLRSVEDPHDDLSPVHTWTARFSEREARRRLRDLTAGRFQGLEVASRSPSGRAATMLDARERGRSHGVGRARSGPRSGCAAPGSSGSPGRRELRLGGGAGWIGRVESVRLRLTSRRSITECRPES